VLIDAASLGGIPKNFKVLRQMIPVCRPRDDDRRPSVERRLLAALGGCATGSSNLGVHFAEFFTAELRDSGSFEEKCSNSCD